LKILRILLLTLVLAPALLPHRARAAEPELPPAPSLKAILAQFDNTDTPAAWAGIWTFDTTIKECTTGAVLASNTTTDTLCTGDPYDPGSDEDFQFDCTGTVTDTHLEATCTATGEVSPGCTMHLEFQTTADRDGDSYTSVTTSNVSYTGDTCGPLQPSCTRIEGTGTRIAGEPASCVTPVEARTWSGLKTLYRD